MINGKNNSLKEYYIKLHDMYNSAVNMLTAINQSLSTSASEITLSVADSNNAQNTVRIPSFLYLENKLEQLENNFNTLFDMPKSGEAWFNNTSNMYKLEMVKSNVAPITPNFNTVNLFANSKSNNIFKDLVNPKTYLKLNITNLPDNIGQMYMKKFIFYDVNLYNLILSKGVESYNDCVDVLYNYSKGIDYDVYDSELKLPIKRSEFNSRFKIIEIPELDSGNPWQDITSSDVHNHLLYKLRLDTLNYTDIEDDSIQFSLKKGDYVTLENHNVVYKVKNVSFNVNSDEESNECYVILEEYIGHIALQTFEENQNMVLTIFNENYSKYHYVEIPLEENPYICVFIGNIYNNVRSLYSKPILLNLNEIQMKDENGNFIYKDNSQTPYTYIEYYNKYCKNIGDLMLGFIETTYPQISNFSKSQLYELESLTEIKDIVSATVNAENILKVQKINDHLTDDITAENIKSLHQEKSEINAQLASLQSNINQVYNQLINTDFSQNNNVTQDSLRVQLQDYYNQRTELQKQNIAIVNNINSLKGNAKGLGKAKFRVRGITIVESLEEFLHSNYGYNCDVIGIEVEYKYKSINSDTTNVSIINSSTFTDWNKQISYDKERKIIYDAKENTYSIQYEDYNLTNNIIKWNQIDIPINQGEDVVVRIRYKYNIGQPFINLYSPWSDELTIVFPAEYSEISELSSIIETNDNDTLQAGFSSTLINEGYQEHIGNKTIDNSQIFYHQPENIYSGFNTPENKFISLKDKLTSMMADLDQYKAQIENELNSEYKVYLEYDDNRIELFNTNETNVSINSNENILAQDRFIKKKMNLVISNTGSINIKLYSIFPGDVNTPLLLDNQQFYSQYIANYERVPLLCGESNIPYENIFYQTLGQWIYFRQDNPYSKKLYYLNDYSSNKENINDAYSEGVKKCSFNKNLSDYLSKDNSQLLLGYKNRMNKIEVVEQQGIKWGKIELNQSQELNVIKAEYDQYQENKIDSDINVYKDKTIDFFIPISEDYTDNKYLLCYEHICGIYSDGKTDTRVFLNETQSISEFISTCLKNNTENNNNSIDDKSHLIGAFFIPHLKSNNDLICNQFDKNQYLTLNTGKSITIPLEFEYYLVKNQSNNINKITKTIAFDLRSSVLKDPEHYVVNVTVNLDQSLSGLEMKSIDTEMNDDII